VIDAERPEEADAAALPRFLAAHVFRPASRDGAIAAAAVGGASTILGVALLVRGAFRGVSFATFGGEVLGVALLFLGGLFLYWAYALYELRYVVDDHSLVVEWALTRVAIPVDQIQRIVLARRYGEPRLSGLSWRGCHVGRARVARIGEVLFYSAHRTMDEVVYVSTPEATFGLSVADPRGLARSIQTAQENLRVVSGPAAVTYRVVPAQDTLRDRRALLLAGAALLAFLLAAGYIYSRYQALPLSLPLGYPPTNGPERIGQRGELLRLPLTALIWLSIGFALAAWSHARLRTVCYALLAGSLFVECLYAVAAIAAAH
jgi:hypothetical protein